MLTGFEKKYLLVCISWCSTGEPMGSVTKKSSRVFSALLALSLLLPMAAEARVSSVTLAASRMRSHSFKMHSGRHHSAIRTGKRHRSKKRRTYARAVSRSEMAVLVESESGSVISEQMSDVAFNPASVVKLITAYAALKTFSPTHRFATNVFLEGELDEETGILTGDAYVDGIDPDFRSSDAAEISKGLRAFGVKKITGKLVVSPQFSMHWSGNPLQSARSLESALKRGSNRITVGGPVVLGAVSPQAQKVYTHESEPLKHMLKHMLSHSINPLSEQLGRAIGGVKRLEEIASSERGMIPNAVSLSSASGLGINRVTAKQMMVLLKALRKELQNTGLDLGDILPLAGIESGTMDRRFTGAQERGSVIAKTGTLTTTDGGVSALAGIMRADKEDLYFIIFCWRGSVNGFRSKQDHMIRQIQATRGGPRKFDNRVAHSTI